MTVTSFRLPQDTMEAIKQKLGLGSPSKLFRVLVYKWLNGEIEISPSDIEKYGD